MCRWTGDDVTSLAGWIGSTEVGTPERIRRARLAAGLSQRELAAVVGLHQTAVSKIETGERAILASELVAFARALRVSTPELLPW